jgi:hypothetical protein
MKANRDFVVDAVNAIFGKTGFSRARVRALTILDQFFKSLRKIMVVEPLILQEK